MSKLRNLVLGLGAIVAVGLGAGAYWYFKIFTAVPTGQDRLLGAAALVPSQAFLSTFITTDQTQWKPGPNAASAPLYQLMEAHLTSLEDEVLKPANVSYETDLAPWVDGVMVAMLPPTEVESQSSPNLLLVVGIKDKLQALAFSQKIQNREGTTLTKSTYQGVDLSQVDYQGQSSYSAVLGDYVVFSPEKRSVEWAIETAQGGESLKTQPGTKEALQGSLELGNPLAQLYISNYGGFLKEAVAQTQGQPLPPEVLEQLATLDHVAAGISLGDTELRLRIQMDVQDDASLPPYEPAAGQVLTVFPGDTLALMSGRDPQALWQALKAQEDKQPGLQVLTQGLERQVAQLQLDLEEDVLSWMTGEFALAALPASTGVLKDWGMAAAIVVESNNPDRTDRTLKQLESLTQGVLQVETATVNDRPITTWHIAQGLFTDQTILGYGWINPQTLFVGLGDTIQTIMALPPDQSLTRDPSFLDLTSQLPKNNGGYFYMNLEGLQTSLNTSPLGAQIQTLPGETQALAQTVQRLGITTSQPRSDLSQVDVLVQLQPLSQAPQPNQNPPDTSPEPSPEG